MTGTERFILIGCLLQGALGGEWAVWMPQSIEALNGSCVLIPCRFDIPALHDKHLGASVSGIWRKSTGTGPVVFNSSTAETKPEQNKIKGTLIGKLQNKTCTTILDSFPSSYSDRYFFRLESQTALKYTFDTSVIINVQDSPPKPKLTPEKVEVMEGTSVSLSCSAAAPCPQLPPNLTWTPRLSDSVDQLQENEDNSTSVSSDLTFTASHLHHGQKITCRALYTLQQGGNLMSEASLTLRVLYCPKKTSVSVSPSGSVFEGSSVTLTCSSKASPPVQNYTWYRVNGRDTVAVRTAEQPTLLVAARAGGHYFCEARNQCGARRSETVFLFFEGSKCSLVQNIIIGALAFFYILTVCFAVYRYKSQSKKIKALQGEKGGDNYASLQISTMTTSDYDVIRKEVDATQGADQGTYDYENIKRKNHKDGPGTVRKY
ncbi:myelin-associated glycoprotein isoform X3 [Conger conger]|uniref:myelin-associated glycoprotein isoform X3 n=1 Tax=Conger conger TaxID=82655 RepID=UPI002A5A9C9D|nr:myelin-associated glycoprotein isoform X3 [Conger conger]